MWGPQAKFLEVQKENMVLTLCEFSKRSQKNYVLHRMLIFEIAKCEMFWRKRRSESMSTDIHGSSGLGPDISPKTSFFGCRGESKAAKSSQICLSVLRRGQNMTSSYGGFWRVGEGEGANSCLWKLRIYRETDRIFVEGRKNFEIREKAKE
jgi:hypothetical protein